MAKERKTVLSAVPSPVAITPDVEPAPASGSTTSRPAPSRAAREPVRRLKGRAPDPRETGAAAALYARVPENTKRNVDVAAAMLGCKLADVVAAVLAEAVDPKDAEKMAALERLVSR